VNRHGDLPMDASDVARALPKRPPEFIRRHRRRGRPDRAGLDQAWPPAYPFVGTTPAYLAPRP
jgi:hypothetical protein